VSPWLDAGLRILAQATVAFALVWLLVRFVPGLTANARAWLWRLAALKCLWTLVATVPIALLPAPVENFGDGPIASVPMPVTEAFPDDLPIAPQPESDRDYFAYLWLAGIAVGVVRLSSAGLRFRSLRTGLSASPDEEANELAAQMGLRRKPLVSFNNEVATPMLLGVWKPIVVLPTALTGDERRMALAHEIGHLQRRDSFWSFALHLISLTFWFVPTIRWAEKAAQLASEEACDAYVLRLTGTRPESYAAMLLRYAKPSPIPAFAVGLSSRKSLEVRIKSMMKPPKTLRRLAYVPLLALLGTALVPWTVVAQEPQLVEVAGGGPQKPLVERYQPLFGHSLLQNPAVRKELHLTADQEARLKESDQRFDEKFKLFSAELARQKRANVSDLDRVRYDQRERAKLYSNNSDDDFNILDPMQRNRLFQITLQVMKEMALGDEKIGLAIHLPEEKRETFAKLVRAHYQKVNEFNSNMLKTLNSNYRLDLGKLNPQERKTYESAKKNLYTTSGEKRRLLYDTYRKLQMKAQIHQGDTALTPSPAFESKVRELATKAEADSISNKQKTMSKIRSLLTPEELSRWEAAKGKPFPIKGYDRW